MFPDPPPDQACDEFAIDLDRVFLRAVGKGDGHTVEVLAYEETQKFYRFDLKNHARVIRKFWKANGVSDPQRLEVSWRRLPDTARSPFRVSSWVTT